MSIQFLCAERSDAERSEAVDLAREGSAEKKDTRGDLGWPGGGEVFVAPKTSPEGLLGLRKKFPAVEQALPARRRRPSRGAGTGAGPAAPISIKSELSVPGTP